MSDKAGIEKAFDAFMTEKFKEAVDKSTVDKHSVELFEDGTYRVLWNNSIGNLYDSPGVILGIPELGDEEWDEDPAIRYYDRAEEEMRESFQACFEEHC